MSYYSMEAWTFFGNNPIFKRNVFQKEKHMFEDKNVIYVGRLHWLLFFWPSLVIVLATFIAIQYASFKELAFMFVAFGIVWWGMTWVIYHFSSLSIEKKRIIFRTGFLVRKITDIPYSKIESLDVRQTLLGSIMGYGAFMVTGSGGTRHYINFLSHPLTCRRYIEERMNAEEG